MCTQNGRNDWPSSHQYLYPRDWHAHEGDDSRTDPIVRCTATTGQWQLIYNPLSAFNVLFLVFYARLSLFMETGQVPAQSLDSFPVPT